MSTFSSVVIRRCLMDRARCQCLEFNGVCHHCLGSDRYCDRACVRIKTKRVFEEDADQAQ